MADDDAQLAEQAWTGATEIVDRYMTFGDTDDDAEARAQFIACAAVAWIEGRQAGGNEAIAVIRGRIGE